MAQESGTKIQVMDQPADTGERVFEIRGKCLEIQHAVHLIKIQIGNLPSSLTFLPSKEANKPIVKSFQKIAKNVSNESKAVGINRLLHLFGGISARFGGVA
jgi:hypothetical protein